VEIVSRTGRDTGQGRTVKEERNCRAGQELPGKGMAHVPGGKGAGGAPSVMTNGRSASPSGKMFPIIRSRMIYIAYIRLGMSS
jgi:hypothetical protein